MRITKLNLVKWGGMYSVDSLELEDYSFIYFPVSNKNCFTDIDFEMLVYIQNYIDTIDINITEPISFMNMREIGIYPLSEMPD